MTGARWATFAFVFFAGEKRGISELLLLTGQCFHDCRTDYCTAEDAHDIVESANPNSTEGFETELEECGEHVGETCAWHECGQGFAHGLEGVFEALRALRGMPAEALVATISVTPALALDPSGRFAQLVGCGGQVLANIPIPADS